MISGRSAANGGRWPGSRSRFHTEWSAEAERGRAESQASRERDAAKVRERRAVLQDRYRATEKSNAEAWANASRRFLYAYRDPARALGADSGEPDCERARRMNGRKSGVESNATGGCRERPQSEGGAERIRASSLPYDWLDPIAAIVAA
jgi:hypothetical protein